MSEKLGISTTQEGESAGKEQEQQRIEQLAELLSSGTYREFFFFYYFFCFKKEQHRQEATTITTILLTINRKPSFKKLLEER